jgi:hypothetical protein
MQAGQRAQAGQYIGHGDMFGVIATDHDPIATRRQARHLPSQQIAMRQRQPGFIFAHAP